MHCYNLLFIKRDKTGRRRIYDRSDAAAVVFNEM